MSIYISLFKFLTHAAIPVNYTSEFLEIIPANAGKFFRPLLIKFRASAFFELAKKVLGKFYILCESLIALLFDSDLRS